MIIKAGRILGMVLAVLLLNILSVFAAEGNVDWDSRVITVTGMGAAPPNAMNPAQARMMARRAAVVDGYRQLAEVVKGVNVDSETTVENMMVTSDVIKTKVSGLIQGASVVAEQVIPGGGYEVTMQMPMFGGNNSLASAVMPAAQAAPEAFPAPASNGSSAADAPAGHAEGVYTGLVVDCRGLGLKPIMSPVIKNEQGSPIYGFKNLDYDKVIQYGMASYSNDPANVARAGAHPLVVKAVRVENHNGYPVISLSDANKVLIENGATHFLDATCVVFIR
jgi:hypothetical protein